MRVRLPPPALELFAKELTWTNKLLACSPTRTAATNGYHRPTIALSSAPPPRRGYDRRGSEFARAFVGKVEVIHLDPPFDTGEIWADRVTTLVTVVAAPGSAAPQTDSRVEECARV